MERSTRIQLCGRVVVRLEGRRIESELPGRQGRLLLVYLVLQRLRPVSRGELVEALWPDGAPGNSDSAVSALLSKLRRVLGSGRLVGRGELTLVLPDGAWIDLEAAPAALHRAEAALERGDFAGAWGPGRVAQHIARRGFLAGEDAPWVADVRGRLSDIHVRALEIVSEACLGIGGFELATAERTARALVAEAPYRESGYRVLMTVLARQGNDAEALRLYDRLRVLLRDQLGVAPSGPTQALHRELLR